LIKLKGFDNNIFTKFQEYPTSTGFVFTKCSRCMNFNNFHAGNSLRCNYGIQICVVFYCEIKSIKISRSISYSTFFINWAIK
jgi:hypothetical protein